jgi:peptide/nickel transport system substrate-binding protein
VLLLGLTFAGGTGEPAPATTTGPKELEELRVGVATLPTGLDATKEASNTGIRITFNIFDTLILSDPKDNFKLKPMLATSWKRISDTVLELKLREDVLWHNGDPLTAQDVKFSFDRVKNPDEPFALARSLLNVIDHVDVVDLHTVRVVTTAPDPILEYRLASTWGAWIMPYEYAKDMTSEEFGLAPIGTGAYRVVEIEPDKVALERFDDFWGEPPAAKRIVYRLIPETAARMTAMINGEVDVISQLPPDQIETMEKYKDITVTGVNIINMHVLIYDTGHPVLSNVKLRQAMNLAIDRELLSETLWHGRAVVPRGHQYPAYGDFYFADRPLTEYNLEKAKKLVAESGYNGEEFDFETRAAYYTYGAEAAEAIVDMWKAVGINAKVVFVDRQKRDQVSNWSNTMRFPDPVGGLWLLWGPESGRQKNNWLDASDEFNALGTELQSILDQDRRKVIAARMMDLFEEEAPGTVLYYPWESWCYRKGLEWEPYSSQAMDFRAGNFAVIE